MREIPLQFGADKRLFGILTIADELRSEGLESQVFVFLNAGLLHRIGPYGLHVRLARELAQVGFSSLRVDLAGVGDSMRRPGLTIEQSVAADLEECFSVLESQLGAVSLVLVGLCSGADNAIRLATEDQRIVGMVLLDPVCSADDGFKTRALMFRLRAFARKCTSMARYIRWLKRRVGTLAKPSPGVDDQLDFLALRHIPTWDETRAAFEAIREREGRVLSVFTKYALPYYNQAGQLGRVIGVDRYEEFCEELFWPYVDHTFPMDSQRHRLLEEIKAWSTR